ncbi:MAG: UDP-N-acetylmuramate dehydrogenase [Ruminococcaceae bacterium]|nr:UDP-N-acetylmuramate dehydrogenase [Oscillospiraceae bacterium]
MTDNLTKLCELVNEYNKTHTDSIQIEYNEPMSRHTTFRIGGIADLYITPLNIQSLTDLCGMIKETGVRNYFLGNGSNVLFDDEGYRGAVVSLCALRGVKCEDNIVFAEAGHSFTALSKVARDNSLTGLEFANGIPGTVGGAVYMNAGAYNGEVAFVLRESTYLDLDDLTVHTITLDEHNFGYRDSIYKHTNRIILSAKFELKPGNSDEITEMMNDFMNRRVTKQPLEYPSAGSVFKRYPGRFTAQMIDEAGLKGYTVGGAQVSEKHAGFIINIGDATAKDVKDLISHIQKAILEKFGCAIEREVIYVE